MTIFSAWRFLFFKFKWMNRNRTEVLMLWRCEKLLISDQSLKSSRLSFLVAHDTLTLIVLGYSSINCICRVVAVVGFAQAFEVFVFDHPEFFTVVETRKRICNEYKLTKLNVITYAISSPASMSLDAKNAILGNLKSWWSKYTRTGTMFDEQEWLKKRLTLP